VATVEAQIADHHVKVPLDLDEAVLSKIVEDGLELVHLAQPVELPECGEFLLPSLGIRFELFELAFDLEQ
jgi:hypothetical protein